MTTIRCSQRNSTLQLNNKINNNYEEVSSSCSNVRWRQDVSWFNVILCRYLQELISLISPTLLMNAISIFRGQLSSNQSPKAMSLRFLLNIYFGFFMSIINWARYISPYIEVFLKDLLELNIFLYMYLFQFSTLRSPNQFLLFCCLHKK